MDSVYDQVCWQQDPPDTGARANQLSAEFIERFGAPERHAYGPTAVEWSRSVSDLCRGGGTRRP